MECIPIAYKGWIWGWQVSTKLYPSIITVCTVLMYSTEVATHNIPEASVICCMFLAMGQQSEGHTSRSI